MKPKNHDLAKAVKEPPPALTDEARTRLLAVQVQEEEITETPKRSLEEIFSALAENAKTPAEVALWTWKNETLPRLIDCGFEDRYLAYGIQLGHQQQYAFDQCRRFCNGSGAIVALVGARGTGKTTIVAQMARQRAEDESLLPNCRGGHYRKMADLLAHYKAIYTDQGTIEPELLMQSRNAFCRLNLVFIDEIHDADELKLKGRMLTDILDRRYAARKDTILISNQSVREFQSAVGDSVLSRMSEHGSIIPCNWKSYR